jgi:serine/threonine protein kinase
MLHSDGAHVYNILATPASVPELADLGYVDVKLVDFGEAQPLSRLGSSTCTMHTANVETTQYRAPELFQVPNNCCTGVCISEVLDMMNTVQIELGQLKELDR